MTNKLAIEINEVLHKAIGENDKLAYHMARGLSEKIAAVVEAEQPTLNRMVDTLAQLIVQLLRYIPEENSWKQKATAYLKKNNLLGSVLRSNEVNSEEVTITPQYVPWEYVVRTLHALPQGTTRCPSDVELTAQLDSEGDQEWELVSFDFATNRAVFKRRKTVK